MPSSSRIFTVNLALLAALLAAGGAWFWLEKGPLGAQHWADALARNHPRRFEAAGALREMGRKAQVAVPALLRVLEDSTDPLAPTAAGALVHIDAERGYEFAQSLARRGEIGPQTLAIFGELGAVAWQAAPLLRQAMADPNTREPERVMWALLRSGDFGDDILRRSFAMRRLRVTAFVGSPPCSSNILARARAPCGLRSKSFRPMPRRPSRAAPK